MQDGSLEDVLTAGEDKVKSAERADAELLFL